MRPKSATPRLRGYFPAALIVLCLASPALISRADAAGLAVQRLSLHEYEDGPLVGASYEYLPGEIAWFTGRVTGYQRDVKVRADGTGDDERVSLAWTIRITDPAGVLLEPARTGRIDTHLQEQDKDWIAKFGFSFPLPEFAPKGIYRITATIKDEIAGKEISDSIPFHVRADDLPSATSLALSNFRFLAHEDDRFALKPAVYKRGDSLITRFDIVGYSFADKNRYSVEFGITVLGPQPAPETDPAPGSNNEAPARKQQVLFTQVFSAQEEQGSFYPQRRVPAGFKLLLDEKAPLGMQTMIVTVRDKLSGRSQEFRQTFEVR